jgi:hypothetical protein
MRAINNGAKSECHRVGQILLGRTVPRLDMLYAIIDSPPAASTLDIGECSRYSDHAQIVERAQLDLGPISSATTTRL